DLLHYHTQTQLVAGSSPAISGDGSTILVEQGDGSIGIYDLQGHSRGTITSSGVGATGVLLKPAISADGHLIAVWSSDSAGAGHLYTYDLSTATVSDIASTTSGAGTAAASISADGHYVVYQSTVSGHSEIYLYDTAAHHVVFSTALSPEIVTGASRNPVISPDGHFIIFTSDAQLTADDKNSFADTYIVDVTNPADPVFKLVSAGSNAASDGGVAISAGGLYSAFASNGSFSGGNSGSSNIFIADGSSGHSAIIQETASSPVNLTASGVITITGGGSGETLSVTDQFGHATGLLSASFNADGNIKWDFSEAKSDFASLQYGQDLSQQFTITLSFSGGSFTIPVTVNVHNAVQPVITMVNAAPVIHSATLTVSEGETVALSAANIGITDPDDSSFTFKVTNVAHGQFQVLDGGIWKNTATFTSAELAGGAIRFIHDGGEFAPTFSIQADDGHAVNHRSNVLAGTVNFTHVNDAPVITAASLFVGQGRTVVLGASDLHITHTDSFANFSGFPTRTDLPPFANDSTAGSVLVSVSSGFSNNISVNDPDSSSFTFTVTNVTHGVFQTTADGVTWADATTFTTDQMNAGHVRFAQDGSSGTPTFSIQADDGSAVNHLSGAFAGGVTLFSGTPGTIYGDVHNNVLFGTPGNDVFQGFEGNDAINGFAGFDTAVYTDATAAITIDLASGRVHGTAPGDTASIGTDTLRSVESISGSNFADSYSAIGFGDANHLDAVTSNVGSLGTFNEFQGFGGNDSIQGNGNTQISYTGAAAGVVVDFNGDFGGLGTAFSAGIGDAAKIGVDTFTGVNSVVGSNFDDRLLGNSADNTLNGGGGNDWLDGRGGNDLLIGGAGADTFVYADGYGATT
ncbi:MAG TPA: cadherin-like domain-containing protein, partial [Bradyrhizobium sp.]|nr:cadherin-like domain-containing protein [Bradyrhizobium sp.]